MSEDPTQLNPPINLPRHVAIVMDGNGRWAKARNMPRLAGHRKGVNAVRAVVECAGETGIPNLSLFAFSSENWNRPEAEVGGLMSLFMTALTKEVDELQKVGVRLRMAGETSRFSPDLRRQMEIAEKQTAEGTRLNLNICINYGGRWDIVNACRQIVSQGIAPDKIDEKLFSQYLQVPDSGDVDLMIRSGGESRISNFFLWQDAYAELYFTPVLWPDFGKKDFLEALQWYAHRQRRFGKTGDQVQQPN
ncbi:MAG: di-trans,poly-cis-decaprenylcistransferase [Burkholderiales bacterium]|nr:di-trans,poly-cis-decaprenylcistransferase [Burkholderiales bacterium]